MEALVLEPKGELSLREIDLPVTVGPHDVKNLNSHGRDLRQRDPLLRIRAELALRSKGADGAGTRSCRHGRRSRKPGKIPGRWRPGLLEPGVPDPNSRASRLGIYNLDPAVRF